MRFSLRYGALALVLTLAMATSASQAQVLPVPTGTTWELVAALALAPPAEPLAGELERFLVALDDVAFTSGHVRPGDAIFLMLPAGQRDFAVSRVDRHLPGTVSVTAIATDGSGEVAALTYGPGGVLGSVSDGDELFQLFPVEGGTAMARMDPEGMDILACGVDEHDHAPTPPGQAGRATLTSYDASPSMPAMAAAVSDPITIDLLIPYTANAVAWATVSGLTIDQVIAQSLALSQLALDNSDTGITLRVVHAYQTDYASDDTFDPPADIDGDGDASVEHIRRLTASPTFNPWDDTAGFLEEVHVLRDQYGADLVAMFARISDTGGLAWLLSNIGGIPEIGFSVNRVQQVARTYTLVHEIGHNLGNSHGRDQEKAAAGARGGLFPYSVGWRWSGTAEVEGGGTRSYNSVMSYGRAGDIRVGHFSNPFIEVDGTPTGSYTGPFAPADAARSMREVKRSVASYRPTLVDPPVVAVEEGGISVEVPRDGGTVQALTISNTGASDLMWELDLARVSATVGAARADLGLDYVGEALVHADAPVDASLATLLSPGNLSPSAVGTEADLLIIYATRFSAAEGFGVGDHVYRGGWVSSRNDAPFSISTENPNRGTRHLRIPAAAPAQGTVNVYSPYFGPWPTGRYDFSADLAVSATGGSTYFFLLTDGRTGNILAGIRLSGNGAISTYGPQQDNFTPVTNHTWEPGVYRRYTAALDPEEGLIQYLIDGEMVASEPLAGGTGFGQVWIQRSSGAGADFLDVDDVIYQSFYTGFVWLTPNAVAGVIPPGGQSEVLLTFDGAEVGPGTYDAELVLRSNDPARPVLRVPVTLTVGTQVGTEDSGLAEQTRLLGNHPNPFSNTTQVGYVLTRPAHVTLEVFTVTGQRVAVLADTYQAPGIYEHAFETSGLASGVYIYRLRAGDTVDTGRMLLVR